MQPIRRAALLLLAILTGVIAGLGALFFRGLIALVHNLSFFGKFSFVYDANQNTPASPWGIAIILVPVIGSVLVTFLVTKFAPEAKGHGVPEVMDAAYYGKGIIRQVVAVIKSLASALCIGTGGSVGREGPIAQIGSAFGSTICQIIPMTPTTYHADRSRSRCRHCRHLQHTHRRPALCYRVDFARGKCNHACPCRGSHCYRDIHWSVVLRSASCLRDP